MGYVVGDLSFRGGKEPIFSPAGADSEIRRAAAQPLMS